ncbi:MAG: hypothetical protein JWQ98_2249 [Chlorobi bacterium]|nr:hypothetical protein [Chlorobiota bacterium]
MATASQSCTCPRRYWICLVPLISVLIVIGLGWAAGDYLCHYGASAGADPIQILGMNSASIPWLDDSASAPVPVGSAHSTGTTTKDSVAVAAANLRASDSLGSLKAMKYAALMKWGGSLYFNLVLFVAVMLFGLAITILALRQGCAETCFLKQWYAMPGLLALLGILFVLCWCGPWQTDTAAFTHISIDLLKRVIGVQKSAGLVHVAAKWDRIGFLVVTMMAIAAGSTLNTTRCRIPATPEGIDHGIPNVKIPDAKIPIPAGPPPDDIHILEKQTNRLRTILYICSVVLVFSLYEASNLLHLATAFINPLAGGTATASVSDPFVTGIDSVVGSLILFRALLYALLLMAIYIPAAAIIRKRSIQLAEQVPGNITIVLRDTWLTDRGLNLTPLDLTKPVFAMLGPLIALPVGDLLGRL